MFKQKKTVMIKSFKGTIYDPSLTGYTDFTLGMKQTRVIPFISRHHVVVMSVVRAQNTTKTTCNFALFKRLGR